MGASGPTLRFFCRAQFRLLCTFAAIETKRQPWQPEGSIKMRSDGSLFKNRPVSSKFIMHRPRRHPKHAEPPDIVGIICWNAILNGWRSQPHYSAGGTLQA